MLGLIRHVGALSGIWTHFPTLKDLKGIFYYLFEKHELIDWLVTDLSGMSTMIYIQIDLNAI